MTTVTRPRGPLPARVYWTRRLLLVVVAFALVFGIAHLLGSGGSGGPSAQPVGAAVSPTTTPTTGPAATGTASPTGTGKHRSRAARNGTASPTPTPLAVPTGPCAGSDVVATPAVKGKAYAGSSVVFAVSLATKVAPACTWTVSPRALVVKVTSGADRVWSTQQCTGAVPKQEVVVRKDHPVTVAVGWNGQRSDSTCSRSTAWAEPGYYHVVSAAFGADPVDVQFELLQPVAPTITATPTPSSPTASPSR
jgi:hypothetical protein